MNRRQFLASVAGFTLASICPVPTVATAEPTFEICGPSPFLSIYEIIRIQQLLEEYHCGLHRYWIGTFPGLVIEAPKQDGKVDV